VLRAFETKMFKKIYNFFNDLEVNIRSHLSRYPILYGIIGGVAIVLFWRGVWHMADELELGSLSSFLIGVATLLFTGLLTASFIGDHIIISGLRREKKVVDLEESQIKTERDILKEVKHDVEHVEQEMVLMEHELKYLENKEKKTP